ncbi:transposase [Patescibacteria group bacterium]|nr:transposase [Patescibacteria group bacterium]
MWWLKRGQKIGYCGWKHQRGEKTLALADNLGNIIAPMKAKAVNIHDCILFNESFNNLIEIADLLELDIQESFITLDSGFDSIANQNEILKAGLRSVIKPNLRGMKNQDKIEQKLNEFESLLNIYKERFKIERCFAWKDVYRKLVIRYERLQCTFMGFRYLAYSMINYRGIFK